MTRRLLFTRLAQLLSALCVPWKWGKKPEIYCTSVEHYPEWDYSAETPLFIGMHERESRAEAMKRHGLRTVPWTTRSVTWSLTPPEA